MLKCCILHKNRSYNFLVVRIEQDSDFIKLYTLEGNYFVVYNNGEMSSFVPTEIFKIGKVSFNVKELKNRKIYDSFVLAVNTYWEDSI